MTEEDQLKLIKFMFEQRAKQVETLVQVCDHLIHEFLVGVTTKAKKHERLDEILKEIKLRVIKTF